MTKLDKSEKKFQVNQQQLINFQDRAERHARGQKIRKKYGKFFFKFLEFFFVKICKMIIDQYLGKTLKGKQKKKKSEDANLDI